MFAQLIEQRVVVRVDTRLRNRCSTGTTYVWSILLGADNAANRTVRQQIRITTDRRGEVRIRFIIETEVAVVVRAVNGLAQRTQHDGLNQVVIRAVTNGFKQRLIILRCRTFLAFVQRQTQLTQECTQFFQTLWRRTIMDAVQRGNFVLLQELRGGHVGGQHALFDQLVSIVASGRTDFGNLALGTEDDPGFLSFEIDRTAHMTRTQQHLVHGVKLLEVRNHVAVFATKAFGFSRFRLFQDRADLVVGQASVGVDDAFVEYVVSHLAGLGDGHLANHGQTINVRVQRAQAVGQLLRQHGHDSLGEVHRVAANLGFSIQRRADFHVARYVGHAQVKLPATGEQAQFARLGFAINRVVEIASVFAVDGHKRQVAQVYAIFLVLLFDFRLELRSFLEYSLRPHVRNIVSA